MCTFTSPIGGDSNIWRFLSGDLPLWCAYGSQGANLSHNKSGTWRDANEKYTLNQKVGNRMEKFHGKEGHSFKLAQWNSEKECQPSLPIVGLPLVGQCIKSKPRFVIQKSLFTKSTVNISKNKNIKINFSVFTSVCS